MPPTLLLSDNILGLGNHSIKEKILSRIKQPMKQNEEV